VQVKVVKLVYTFDKDRENLTFKLTCGHFIDLSIDSKAYINTTFINVFN